MTSSPAARALSTVRSSASHPGEPRRSNHATWGLTATHAGPAASISSSHWAAIAVAARSAADPASAAASRACGHSRAGSGSRPRTTWERRRSTAAASRSAKPAAADGPAAPVAEADSVCELS